MMSLVRPSFHAFTIAMLACACLLVAQTVNTVLSASLAPLPTAAEPARQETTSQRTRTLAVGSALQGAEVLAIDRTRVLLLNNGQVEILDIASSPATPGMPPASPVPAAPMTGFGSTLRQTGPDAYAIARQDVENTLANLNQIAMQARVVPFFKDGVSQGFKLFAMRPDSLYARLGLKNGDILQRVNGSSLNDPRRAMEAYHSMKGSSRIELEIERDGQPLRKTYTVED